MKKLLQRAWKNEKGFTLIELIIVIAILAIIAAVAIPNILSAVDNSRKTTDVTNAKMIANAAATVKARSDAFGDVAGDYTFSSAGIVADPDTLQDFADAVEIELNNAVPLPKYKGGDAEGATSFIMTIDGDSVITIVTNASDGDLQVFPNADDAYTNK